MTFLIAGFIGGLLRGAVGISKYMRSYKDVEVRPWYFGGMALLSGIIGGVAAWVTNDLGITFLGIETFTPALGIVIGYAGGDFIENIFKIISGDTNIFSHIPIDIGK